MNYSAAVARRSTRRTVRAVDLFAGAGGASVGLTLAASAARLDLDLTAINHWRAAVRTHQTNYPRARHLCESVERVDPRHIVPDGRLDLLVAGPECTFFSRARGGKPIDDQRRSSAWSILRWPELLTVNHILIENVPEFETWGPLDARGRPLASRRGEIYRAFLAALTAMGYRVEARLLNAADYGEATTRTRLFIRAARGRQRITWPEPTHSRTGEANLLRHVLPWRPAKDVIDWTLPSQSIFRRKRALSPNTLRRIETGLKKFCGRPFLLSQQSGGAPRQTDAPMPTIAAGGAISFIEAVRDNHHDGEIEAFTLPYCSNGGQLARPVSRPLGTITTRARLALVVPDGVDIRFRMLQPHELSAAMGFPTGYRFVGTKTDAIRMIGNAWSCRVAQALCAGILADVAGAASRAAA